MMPMSTNFMDRSCSVRRVGPFKSRLLPNSLAANFTARPIMPEDLRMPIIPAMAIPPIPKGRA